MRGSGMNGTNLRNSFRFKGYWLYGFKIADAAQIALPMPAIGGKASLESLLPLQLQELLGYSGIYVVPGKRF